MLKVMTGIGVMMVAVTAAVVAGPVQVCALHPLLADLARQVGGERVNVIDLVGEGGNPHRFEPRPEDLRKMQQSTCILAAGKNQEPYLSRLKDTVEGVALVDLGLTIPSLTVTQETVQGCCPQHAAGIADPHWWHGVENMRRASRVLAKALTDKDPAGGPVYQNNAKAFGERLEQLHRWARGELGKIPRNQRKLVTAHNAFAYFAKEFDFEVIAVAGLNNEQSTTPQELAATIEAVRKAGVKVIFPEQNANAKVLESIATATGCRLARPLISDGNGRGKDAGFEAMIRHNVESITQAVATP